MKNKKVRQGSIDLMVKIIDWSPINKKISEAVGEDVECRIGNGFIDNVQAIFDKDNNDLEIKSLITDKECCCRASETHRLYISELNDNKPFQVDVIPCVEFYKVSVDTENGKRISMFPSYSLHIDLDDIKKCFTGEEIPLYEFMGSRYRYNSRIDINEVVVLKLAYHQDFSEGKRESLNEIEMEISY